MSEMQFDVMQKCLLFAETYKKNTNWMGYLFCAMFSLHLFSMCVILTLSDLWVLTSFTPLDAINNSLSILILNQLHLMGSKFFIK